MENSLKKYIKEKFHQAFRHVGCCSGPGLLMPALGKEPTILKTETAENLGIDLNAWISIDTSGKVTIPITGLKWDKVHFNRASDYTEELEVNLDMSISFRLRRSEKYGSQITGGSSTIRGFLQKTFESKCLRT